MSETVIEDLNRSSAIVDRPNSDNGSIGSINLELIPPYPSTGSEHSSDPIRIAEGPLPEFALQTRRPVAHLILSMARGSAPALVPGEGFLKPPAQQMHPFIISKMELLKLMALS
ncbi:hypothetical protein H4R33_006043 [Dimargaris cristalligena]|nr:hypothetical protein H4R33_006043 [Dimargaris cristalligena]